MEHLHDDLTEADLKFLQKFGMIEDDKQDVDEATSNPEAKGEHGDEPVEVEAAPVEHDVEADVETEAEGDDDLGEFLDELPEDDESALEGEGESEGDGEGEHTQNQEAEQEGIDQTDKQRDPEGGGQLADEGEGEPDDDAKDAPPEVEGDESGEADDLPEPDAEAQDPADDADGPQNGQEDPQEGNAEGGDDGESGSDEDDEQPQPQDREDEAEDDPFGDDEDGSMPDPQNSQGDGDEDEQDEADEGEPQDRQQPKPECDGDCADHQDEDGQENEPCDYCTEKQARREQREREHSTVLGYDREGEPILHGSEIRSRGRLSTIERDVPEYVGVVMGVWEDTDADLQTRMLIVLRRDNFPGEWKLADEDRLGWAVRSDLCDVLPEDDEPEPQPEKRQQEKQAYFLDVDGTPLVDGDQVVVVDEANFCDWPIEAIAQVCEVRKDGVTNPGLVPQNFADDTLGRWQTWDDKPAFAVGWGNTLDGIRKHVHHDEPKEKPEKQPREDKPKDETPPPPPQDEDDGERKPMTKQQAERFENLAERIFKKAEATFGGTTESVEAGPNLPGGIFDGEEVGRVLEVKSRGVVYRITLSAERYE